MSLTNRGVLGSAFAALAILVTAGCSNSGVYATTQIPTPAPPTSPPEYLRAPPLLTPSLLFSSSSYFRTRVLI